MALGRITRTPIFICTAMLIAVSARNAVTQNAFWVRTGNLNDARLGSSLVTLRNGKALILGHLEQDRIAPELFDPVTGTWSFTTNMHFSRAFSSTVVLRDGRVLSAGGMPHRFTCAGPPVSNSAEVFDTVTATWALTGPMVSSSLAERFSALLADGRVLVGGGWSGCGGEVNGRAVEIYDPATNTWSPTGSLNIPRFSATNIAVTLSSGKVLVAGGRNGFNGNDILHSAVGELYDPATGTWTATGTMSLARSDHTLTLLPNGKVLAIGGCTQPLSGFAGICPDNTADLYDPATGTWSLTSSMTDARYQHTATLLSNGQVLAVGGLGGGRGSFTILASAELFDPATATWNPSPLMNEARFLHSATLLSNGQVLVAGGALASAQSSPSDWRSAELFISNQPPTADAGPDKIVECTSPAGASVTLDGSGSSDPDGDTLTFTWTGPFGTLTGQIVNVTLPLGTHTINLTVDDGNGGTASDSVVVAVRDTTPPTITGVSADPSVLWPPNHNMVDVTVNYSATDNCTPSSSLTCTLSVTSNEPINGTGDGDLAPDWEVVDANHVRLRAERAGIGNERTYTITITCTDGMRNSSSRTVTVTVPKNQS